MIGPLVGWLLMIALVGVGVWGVHGSLRPSDPDRTLRNGYEPVDRDRATVMRGDGTADREGL